MTLFEICQCCRVDKPADDGTHEGSIFCRSCADATHSREPAGFGRDEDGSYVLVNHVCSHCNGFTTHKEYL